MEGIAHFGAIHLNSRRSLDVLRRELNGEDQRVHLFIIRLNSVNDPVIESVRSTFWDRRYVQCLVANPIRLARSIEFLFRIRYSAIESVAPGLEIDILKRFTDLEELVGDEPVHDVDRFLKLLEKLNVSSLDFVCDQPQQLFDHLPDRCTTVQQIAIHDRPTSLGFLLKMHSLTNLCLSFSVDTEFITRVSKELEYLCAYNFDVNGFV